MKKRLLKKSKSNRPSQKKSAKNRKKKLLDLKKFVMIPGTGTLI